MTFPKSMISGKNCSPNPGDLASKLLTVTLLGLEDGFIPNFLEMRCPIQKPPDTSGHLN